tara:strand:+ start:637 stop:1647 length:1011 start_codon:yes stop_codon:yes gene_type:complete
MDNTFNISNRRYTGSKAKLVGWINEIISTHCKTGNKLTDIFAGTGVVAFSNLDKFDSLIINDFLYSNEAIYKGFLGNGKWCKKKIKTISDSFKDINPKKLKDNYFSKNFGGKFFSLNDAKTIGAIREILDAERDNYSNKEFDILLSSLIYSADKVANTVGHYDAYRIRNDLEDRFIFNQISPISHKKEIKIFRKDANQLIRDIKTDVLYIDPPYNSRQYSRFYHVLENLTQWKKPKLFGVALKPEPENMSEYCKVGAYDQFKDLIENANAKEIIVSYNNTYKSKSSSSKNKITHEQILSVLRSKGKTLEFSKIHSHFNAGKTKFNDHKEFLFVTRA